MTLWKSDEFGTYVSSKPDFQYQDDTIRDRPSQKDITLNIYNTRARQNGVASRQSEKRNVISLYIY